MRMLFGIVLGVFLTVSLAFIADSWQSGPAASTTGSATAAVEHRNMMNWDVVGENMRILSERAKHAWARLSQKISS